MRSWITTVLATNLNLQWLGNAFAHLLKLPLPYFEKRHTGDIASLPALSDSARNAFAVIAERVERSLFALRRLSAEDWQAARAAYAEFALAAPGSA